MKELVVHIEVNGNYHVAGYINGNTAEDATFSYDRTYLENNSLRPISISLPKEKESFSPKETRNFFDGLLPEGFTRRSVASNIHASEEDYLAVLEHLGRECIGALKITGEGDFELSEEYRLLSLDQVRALAAEGATKSAEIVLQSHLSLAGASGKVGLMYYAGDWYQPLYDAASSHIVKQSHVRLDSVVLNEYICLLTAKKLGINVAENSIINVGEGNDDDVLFASKRYDREIIRDRFVGKINKMARLHQEDFSQALGISAMMKYEQTGDKYFVKMVDVIRKYSANPIEDILNLWDITIFNYLIGNTDNHIKNHALLYSADMSSLRLAPAYDILSTCIYESCTRNMSYRIGGECSIDELKRNHFLNGALEIGLGSNLAMKHFDEMANRFEAALKQSIDEISEEGFEVAYDVGKRILNRCGYTNQGGQ